jgi:Ca2+-binding EF-hand superfamily protein
LLNLIKTQLDRKEKEALFLLFELLDENKDSFIHVSDVIKHYKDKFSITVTEADFDRCDKHL